MFEEGGHAESSSLALSGSNPPSLSARRATITATIIREEAAESLLPDIHGDVELAVLALVLNRYKAAWWLKHLRRVGADPVSYWRKQLGEEIKEAMRGKCSPPQRKKFPWYFFQNFTVRATYDVVDLHLDPLS